MKVLMLETNTVEDFANRSFALRLIEQGKAVLPPAPVKKAEAPKKKVEKKE